jgi:hypothetical protein
MLSRCSSAIAEKPRAASPLWPLARAPLRCLLFRRDRSLRDNAKLRTNLGGSFPCKFRSSAVNVQIEPGRIWRRPILRTNARANVIVSNVIIMALPGLKGHGGMTIGTIFIPPNSALNNIAEAADCRVPDAVFRVGVAVSGYRFCFGGHRFRFGRFLSRPW